MNLQQLLRGLPAEWASFNAPLKIDYAPFANRELELFIKREDLLHEQLSGNKIYKLHGHLLEAARVRATRLVSFGGYYSNHLHALAAVGAALNLRTTGIVRGHQPPVLSPTLQDCRDWGMQLTFISRRDYARIRQADCVTGIPGDYTNAYLIPEGGAGRCGAIGCGPILTALRQSLDLSDATVCIPCGSGTSLAGLLGASRANERLLGFAALRLGSDLPEYRAGVERLLAGQSDTASWDITDEFACGGFARVSPELLQFMRHFEAQTGIPLDPVYTGKMMFGIIRLAQRGFWPAGHRIVAIHTGGLQGRRGYPDL